MITAPGSAAIYVSMVLSGSIQRFDIMYDADAQNIMLVDVVRIATGYTFKRDTAGLVLGPAGLFHFTKIDPATGYRHDDLYVANSADDTIYLVTDAGWTYQKRDWDRHRHPDPRAGNGARSQYRRQHHQSESAARTARPRASRPTATWWSPTVIPLLPSTPTTLAS